MPRYFLYRFADARLKLVETYHERVTLSTISDQYAYDSAPSEIYFLVDAVTGGVAHRLTVKLEKHLVAT